MCKVGETIRKLLKNQYFRVINPIQVGGMESAPPPKVFPPKRYEILKRNFLTLIFTPLTVILHILSITILIRGCHSDLLFTVCHVIFAIEKTKLELFSRLLLDQAQIW